MLVCTMKIKCYNKYCLVGNNITQNFPKRWTVLFKTSAQYFILQMAIIGQTKYILPGSCLVKTLHRTKWKRFVHPGRLHSSVKKKKNKCFENERAVNLVWYSWCILLVNLLLLRLDLSFIILSILRVYSVLQRYQVVAIKL